MHDFDVAYVCLACRLQCTLNADTDKTHNQKPRSTYDQCRVQCLMIGFHRQTRSDVHVVYTGVGDALCDD